MTQGFLCLKTSLASLKGTYKLLSKCKNSGKVFPRSLWEIYRVYISENQILERHWRKDWWWTLYIEFFVELILNWPLIQSHTQDRNVSALSTKEDSKHGPTKKQWFSIAFTFCLKITFSTKSEQNFLAESMFRVRNAQDNPETLCHTRQTQII